MYVSVRDRPGQTESGAAPAARRVATTVVVLGLVSLFTDISSEMVNAVLPVYLTAEVGLSLVAYGLVDGVYQGVSGLVRLVGGFAGDRGEQPKLVAVIGYGVSALSRLAMFPAHGLTAILGVISADRLGKGLRTAPRDALIAANSDPANLGRSFGVHRALDTVGAAVGPIVAFGILALLPGSYRSVWVASFAAALIGVAVLVLLVPNRRTASGAKKPGIGALLKIATGRAMRKPVLAAALLGLFTVGDGFLYLSLQHRDDFAAQWFPLLYVGTNIAYLALAIPLGRLADRIGKPAVLIGGHVVLVAVYITAAVPVTGLAWTIVTLALLGTFYAATDGVLSALISRLIPEQGRGTGLAAAQTVQVFARFASSVAFGSLSVALGPARALTLVSVLLAIVIPVAAWLLATRTPVEAV
ncbi:MFS transporter [Hamadaea tsunoensis]|uniref:MFS transporter n=1 Tax=Hamadaea tsunoensis TaxID=53368 RepID=UPI00041169A5|nr:MFS transporter [Hamadaea tsunoensis]